MRLPLPRLRLTLRAMPLLLRAMLPLPLVMPPPLQATQLLLLRQKLLLLRHRSSNQLLDVGRLSPRGEGRPVLPASLLEASDAPTYRASQHSRRFAFSSGS
jgi:hypothetical protein